MYKGKFIVILILNFLFLINFLFFLIIIEISGVGGGLFDEEEEEDLFVESKKEVL